MENEITAQDKRKKIWFEAKDLLAGAAFPLMLMLVFGAAVLSFASYNSDIALSIIVLVIGEILLVGSYVIFGRQNGRVAVRKNVQNNKKRASGTEDLKAAFHTGEYALYKGFLIGFISCIPYILVQIIQSAAPNSVCSFLLQYAFGWAYYPLSYFKDVSSWVNLIWVIPLTCVHAAAYFWGAKTEEKKQQQITEAQEIKDKHRKK